MWCRHRDIHVGCQLLAVHRPPHEGGNPTDQGTDSLRLHASQQCAISLSFTGSLAAVFLPPPLRLYPLNPCTLAPFTTGRRPPPSAAGCVRPVVPGHGRVHIPAHSTRRSHQPVHLHAVSSTVHVHGISTANIAHSVWSLGMRLVGAGRPATNTLRRSALGIWLPYFPHSCLSLICAPSAATVQYD